MTDPIGKIGSTVSKAYLGDAVYADFDGYAIESARLDADDADWAAMHPTADQIRAAHGWPQHVHVSEEAESLRLRVVAIKRRMKL